MITALGADASCREAGSWFAHDGPGSSYDRMVQVNCKNAAGTAVGTAFHL